MRLRLLFPFALLAFALPLAAADSAPPAAGTADFSALKTADDFWKHLQKLQDEPKEQPTSREEALAQVRNWLATQKTAAEAFAKIFPEDPRRWQARLFALRISAEMRRVSEQVVVSDEDRKAVADIVAAPDVPPPIKGEAAFMGVMQLAVFDKARPETFAPFYRAAGEFLEKYADHPLAPEMKAIQLRVLNEDLSSKADELLKKLAAGPDPRVAEPARAMLERRQKMADLRSKPVDLKFTATDGREVDFASLRGKVVLIDFWGSFCGPCLLEMPNLVSAYKKYHDRGFEVVGISLDQDKEEMEGVVKKHAMTWPQYFDGGGWQNRIAVAFDVTALPSTWLIDKKGMVRATGLHGEELTAGVEVLLAE
jgi:peroxiredoxin